MGLEIHAAHLGEVVVVNVVDHKGILYGHYPTDSPVFMLDDVHLPLALKLEELETVGIDIQATLHRPAGGVARHEIKSIDSLFAIAHGLTLHLVSLVIARIERHQLFPRRDTPSNGKDRHLREGVEIDGIGSQRTRQRDVPARHQGKVAELHGRAPREERLQEGIALVVAEGCLSEKEILLFLFVGLVFLLRLLVHLLDNHVGTHHHDLTQRPVIDFHGDGRVDVGGTQPKGLVTHIGESQRIGECCLHQKLAVGIADGTVGTVDIDRCERQRLLRPGIDNPGDNLLLCLQRGASRQQQ